ncbi:MAG: tyrosine-type recombinase/integrase [Egibacteraceae bacterium]
MPLPRLCADALREHRERQEQERAQAVVWFDEWDLVFTTKHGTPIEPRNLLRHFQAVCARLGLPKLRFHDLRHTCASLLLAQGVELPVLKETLAVRRSRRRCSLRRSCRCFSARTGWMTFLAVRMAVKATKTTAMARPRNHKSRCGQRLREVVRGGIEPPTSRFSGADGASVTGRTGASVLVKAHISPATSAAVRADGRSDVVASVLWSVTGFKLWDGSPQAGAVQPSTSVEVSMRVVRLLLQAGASGGLAVVVPWRPF